jgi:hypothetical protein
MRSDYLDFWEMGFYSSGFQSLGFISFAAFAAFEYTGGAYNNYIPIAEIYASPENNSAGPTRSL